MGGHCRNHVCLPRKYVRQKGIILTGKCIYCRIITWFAK